MRIGVLLTCAVVLALPALPARAYSACTLLDGPEVYEMCTNYETFSREQDRRRAQEELERQWRERQANIDRRLEELEFQSRLRQSEATFDPKRRPPSVSETRPVRWDEIEEQMGLAGELNDLDLKP
jgi:hypothetical protein